MKPAAFDYHAPTGLTEAVSLLAELGDDAKVIAGGQSLMPLLALRLAFVEHLVDLHRVEEMRGIDRRADSVWIGAGTTQATIERSADIAEAVPLLARATPLIGYFQVRNRGTIGGSLAHADAAAEYPAVALTLDAEVEAASPSGRRTIPAAEFFTGVWSTDLAEDEILTGVTFPLWRGRSGFAVEEFASRHRDFAFAGATVAVELDGDDRVRRCAIGLLGLGPTALRARAEEAELTGRHVTEITAEDVGQAAVSGLDSVPSDHNVPAEYRKRVGAAVVARAWHRAIQEASDA
ncbi:FAD binding domain-containing protein [Actinophytocola oryzae]|uniref:Carbon-monoxide dehydrogenase medium subunit n=1 Tax=Actinophytocola oryzae TaxID=502181 RepID=A0A4R7W1D7_9PSEU|nr:FAD binding domain-containing protein [Actinophytocola oryzae]TDV55347.1 carbon-monoxide dehydrogenase medium subunit [Actinophytocola oryzae]